MNNSKLPISIIEAEKRTNDLEKLINYYGELLEINFIHPDQKQTFEDFKCDIIAIADAEISHAKNMGRLEEISKTIQYN